MESRDAAHLMVLKLIEQQPALSQRELARALGVSVGKTHYLLRALLDKGLVKAENFRRSDHKRAYIYQLTPGGVAEKLRLAKGYLVRKEQEYAAIREEISALRIEIESADRSSGQERPGSAA